MEGDGGIVGRGYIGKIIKTSLITDDDDSDDDGSIGLMNDRRL